MITNPTPPKIKEREKKITHIQQHTWSLDEEMLHKGHGGDGDLKDLQNHEITHQQLQFCDSPCKDFNSRPFSWSSSIKTNGCYIHILKSHTKTNEQFIISIYYYTCLWNSRRKLEITTDGAGAGAGGCLYLYAFRFCFNYFSVKKPNLF